MKSGLIIFTKNPILGHAKTRLAKDIGDEAALTIYKDLLTHTRTVAESIPVDRLLYYDQYIDSSDDWDAAYFKKHLQIKGNLGEKMQRAFEAQFAAGYEQVIIIGSDCATLETNHINSAFEALANHEVVFGPSEDGGYYLLGMRKFIPQLFIDKPWSQENLLEVSCAELKALNISFKLLPTLNDIDTYSDWQEWQANK